MTLVVCTSSSLTVCTSDRFARKVEGKAVGLECVTTVLEDVSVENACQCLPAHVRIMYWHTFAGRTADGAGQDHVLLPGAAVEEVAAVGAEDEGADCGHCGGVLLEEKTCSSAEKSDRESRNFAGSTSAAAGLGCIT
jgi:hypothetical protein